MTHFHAPLTGRTELRSGTDPSCDLSAIALSAKAEAILPDHMGAMITRITYLISLISILISVAPAHAIDTLDVRSPHPVTEVWRWTTFDQSTGLAGVVVDIFEDRDQNLWFATDRGAQRYDGWEWTTITKEDGLAGNNVREIFQTPDGAMWFSTSEGLSRRSVSAIGKETWKTWTTEDGLSRDCVIPSVSALNMDSYRTNAIATEDGTIWLGYIGAPQGRMRYFGGVDRLAPDPASGSLTITRMESPFDLSNAPIRDVSEAADGSVLFGTMGQGLLRYKDGTWSQFTREDGLAGDYIYAIHEGRNGRVWIISGPIFSRGVMEGQAGNAIGYYSSENGSYQAFAELGSGWFENIVEDDRAVIWVPGLDGFREDGSRVPAIGDPLSQYRSLFGLTVSDGSTWTFQGATVHRFNGVGRRWQTFVGLQAVSGSADQAFFVEGGEVWLGSSQGLLHFDGVDWTTWDTMDGLLDGSVSTILRGLDGQLWVGGQHQERCGVARFNGNRWQILKDEAFGVASRIYTGLAASSGDLWFGTRGWGARGVLRFDGESWAHYTADDGLPDPAIYSLSESRNRVIWAATRRGIARFDPHRKTGPVWFDETPVELLQGQRTDETYLKIRTVVESSDGSVWIGRAAPDGGVAKRAPSGAGGTPSWIHYDRDSGPAHDGVWRILQSGDGTIWFGTSAGLSRYNGEVWTHYDLGTLGREQPGSSTRVRENNPVRSIREGSEGSIWITVGSTVARFRPNRNPPETEIETNIDLVSSLGNITLEWSAADLWMDTHREEMRYQWRLGDGEWSDATRETDQAFLGLDSGDFRFEVRAIDRDGNIDQTPAVHAFIVEPPWWRDPRFAFPIGGLILMVIVQAARIVRDKQRLQLANNELFRANVQIKEQSERKSAFLASMSHELRTPMNAIKGFTNLVMRREPTLSDRGSSNLQKVDRASDHLLAMINDLLDLSKIEAGRMDVVATTFDLKDLIASSCDTVSPLVKDGVVLNWDADGVGEVHTDQARLRQMLINLLSNAVKFTDEGRVTVMAERGNGRGGSGGQNLVIAVSDTGKGIPADELSTIFDEYRQVKNSDSREGGTGLGLSITKRFAELLGGTIAVESTVGKGSSFTVTLPANHGGDNA